MANTKGERIVELLDIISNKSKRIKKLKLESGQQSTQICVLNLGIKELEEKLEDWENSAKFVLGDDCPTDEVHCGCVVILKKKIKELEDMIGIIQRNIKAGAVSINWVGSYIEKTLKGE